MILEKRKRHEITRGQLESERSSFIGQYRDLNDYILPNRARFLSSDVNKGDRRNTKIIDPTATLAARTLRSGMMSGITSPARPWFRLSTPDPDLSEFGPVKEWLHIVTQRMNSVLLRSNLYNVLPTVYGDLGTFGTAPFSIEEDFDKVVHFASFPVGSYLIGKDHRGRVNVFIREFRMTVRQLIQKFGQLDKSGKPDWSYFSDAVKTAWENGRSEQWIDVVHFVGPNPDYNAKSPLSKFKKFESCYYEKASTNDRYLSERGYDYFPILCPRWEVTGEDVYGTNCPGMTAIGDIKQLQFGEKKIMKAIDKMIDPPMIAPTAMRNQKASILPGDITYDDTDDVKRGFRPVHEVNPRIVEMSQKQDEVRNRINQAFYANLFLMLEQMDRSGVTATEIAERKEEKLVALGPVLEQFNQDGLDPLIDTTFDIMVRQGEIPEPPPELQGVPLKVEYISIMAQAQKTVGISSIERFFSFSSNLAAANPAVMDKINFDQAIDVYGEMTSVPPSIVRTDDQVAEIRAAKAKAQAQAQQAEMVAQGAAAAKNLSQASLDGNSALSQLMNQANAGSLVGGA